MSALDVGAITVAWGVLLVIVGRERIRDVLADLHAGPDRRRHIADCKTREHACGCGGTGTILAEGPCDAAPLDVQCSCQVTARRLRSGAAWAEAMASQLQEIRSLPVIEPKRRLV